MRADYKVIHGCRRPSVAINDFNKEGIDTVNRCCLTCGRHWYGPTDAVKEFTNKEWDAYLEAEE